MTEIIEKVLEKYQNKKYNFFVACRIIGKRTGMEIDVFSGNSCRFNLNGRYPMKLVIEDPNNPSVDPEKILKKVLEVVGVDKDAICAHNRKRELADAKKAFCILAKKLTEMSLSEIGKKINRDYSTVSYNLKKDYYPEVKEIISKTGYVI